MRILSSAIIGFILLTTTPGWETDLIHAEQKATQEHKFILLNFSGSDWCIPCIQLRKGVFESKEFTDFAASNLVLVSADFPRLKKNQLSKEDRRRSDELAEKYNPSGEFPLTLLLDANGKLVRKWEGNPGLSPAQFVSQLKAYTDVRN
jgi:thioredoxin-related protein